MKWMDLPPFWLVGFLALAWVFPLRFSPGGLAYLGWGAIGMAAILVVLAVVEFRKAGTTILPRQAPGALITSGIFRRSRNPIYLADVLVLAGASLIWGSLTGVVLVPVLAGLLQRRFILGEEAMLRRFYGAEYETYAQAVRRWL